MLNFSSEHPEFIRKDKRVREFFAKKQSIQFVDAFERQIKELFLIKNTRFLGMPKDKIYSSKEFKKFVKIKSKDFVFIYYPWNNTLVKSVKEKDYFLLKTNRNQDLITSDEQKKLRDFKVAVLGMSVGSNIAYVLTQAGISKDIILADLDELDTTNLNRIIAGVHQVGINKAVIAARRIYEDNPFAKVRIFRKGMDRKNLEKLLKGKKVDCIVEEVDQIQMKIDTRILAMKYKIPVLMVTDNGDWAVLHIERYDLGYAKIFGKDLDFWNKKIQSLSSRKDFADIAINVVVGGPDKVDPKMLKSVQKVIEGKLVSWPQLGSSALLGAVAVTIAIKKIVRREDKKLFRREYLRLLE